MTDRGSPNAAREPRGSTVELRQDSADRWALRGESGGAFISAPVEVWVEVRQ